MNPFPWTKAKHSVCLRKIDTQHKQLFLLVNELGEAINNGNGEKSLQTIFNKLIAYANYHFCTEESYFCEFHHPDIEKHKREHEFFKNWIMDKKLEVELEKNVSASEVFNFLTDWLQSHIIKTDKRYFSEFIKSDEYLKKNKIA